LITRRELVQCAGLALASAQRVFSGSDSPAKFVDRLPIPDIAKSTEVRPVPAHPATKVPYFRIVMRQVAMKVHRDLPPTRIWGYNSMWPGPTFETRSSQGLLIEWVNELPGQHFLPIDYRLHGAERDKPGGRAVTHLHGAKVPPESDGYPEAWYPPGKSALYYYPNNQEAAMLWYHDHTMGINRLNVYAGLFGAFFIRDHFEDALQLPSGQFEVPLMVCDRELTPDGQLDYPVSGKRDAPWVPDVAGSLILVNGKLFPYLEVAPRKYRFRVLNASNGRFLHLSLSNGQSLHQIGTDQGLLPAPVPLSIVTLAPGERADLVIDFKGRNGETIVVNNDSLIVMQLRVAQANAADESRLPDLLRPVPKIPESASVKNRLLTLAEVPNMVNDPTMMLLNNSHWSMPVTEKPVLDTVEIWTLINLSDDSHPIHLHMVRFQILDRRRFDAFTYLDSGELRYTGSVTPPEAFEAGWKDTVRADPKMVTRIIVRFEGFVGRYVWHCHVLEHEDNEMMRPYDVVPPPAG
jgi:spore coat protein A, manganese oxidase